MPNAPSPSPLQPSAAPLREAHAHVAELGLSLTLASLEDCRSVGQCLDAASQAAARGARGADGGWARLTSARVEGWAESRWPTIAELDGASGDVPCIVMSFDHHTAMANTAALRRLRFVAGQVVPPNGQVCTDLHTGTASGLLTEHAAYAAWSAPPEPTLSERLGHVQTALHHLHALGYSQVHDMHSQPWLGPLLADLERSGGLPIDVWLYPPVAHIIDVWAARCPWQSKRVRLAGAKVFADGTLNSRTALMIHRFASALPGLPRGKAMVSQVSLEESIRLCDGLGLGLAAHAIGDGAVRMVLDAVERVRPARARVRIEHCEVIDKADVPRFVALGVDCSVQPCHLLADVEALNHFLPHRLDRVLPLRELLDSGLRPGVVGGPPPDRGGNPPGLVFGSDVPIVRAAPGDSIRAAVTRRRQGAVESEAIALNQAISEREAWACFAIA